MPILIDRDIPCKMRDGCILCANVFRPSADGQYPTLVFRKPYDKNAAGNMALALDPLRFVEAGYVVVQQDVRGRFASEGVHEPWIEYDDGYDTIEWAAAQPWSSRRVGAYGVSYHGLTAWSAAVTGPPALRAIAATQAPYDHHAVYWRGGAFELGSQLQWSVRVMGLSELLRARANAPADQRRKEFAALVDKVDAFDALARTTPLSGLLSILPDTPFFKRAFEKLDHPTPDEYHGARSLTGRHGGVKVPALITAGWHDVLLQSDLKHYKAIRTEGGSREAREESRLVIGPWIHGPGLQSTAGGEIDYGLRASGITLDLREDLTGYHRRWFDRWLKDAPDHGFAPVRIFVMGENRWRDEDEWPLSRTRPTRWHLHSDGGLSPQMPAADEKPRTYINNPEDPCPSLGGANLLPPAYTKGSVAQGALFQRPDVLIFSSEILAAPLEVTGFVSATLWASTNAQDADWVVKLCDVHPDGRTFNVCDGIVRASRRESDWRTPRPVKPGEIIPYTIDLVATSMTFLPGHRLRVMVTSSDFPRNDRNPGTGEDAYTAKRLIKAKHQIYCDAEHPSHVLLPIVPRN